MIEVAMIRLPDGREFEVVQKAAPDLTYDPDSIRYYWTEGNNGCDCNRALYINRQHGTDLPVECGDTFELVSLTVDGEVLK